MTNDKIPARTQSRNTTRSQSPHADEHNNIMMQVTSAS
jgi:hypothetical protein